MSKRKTTFADEIRQAIAESGMSRYRICKEIGMDQAAMSRFMAGKLGIQLRTLDRLAALLNLHITTGKRKGKR